MTVAPTAYGKVRGAEIADGVLSWRGIPYAAPPAGELRLRPPAAPEPWSGVRDALAYGNRSLQAELPGPQQPQLPPVAEDCLYLNVTAPAGAAGRPVLFWLHGGGFVMGSDVPAADILAAQFAVADPLRSTWTWRPSVDGAALTADPLAAIAGGAAAGVPLLLQTCARETALFQLTTPDAAAQADRVLAGYFGPAGAAELLASYAAAYPELDETALRGVPVMTDERYVVRTERLADAHAPVWRSRYDGPYTGMSANPLFTRYAHLLLGAHGADAAGIWLGSDGLSGIMHDAWGAFATAADPGWVRYEPGRRDAMIFAPDGPRLAADPFAHARRAWAGLDWQPGSWWP